MSPGEPKGPVIDAPTYRVGVAAKMTGLSTHTLRVWEKRYGAVVPLRTEAGGRLYTDADVRRLRMLRSLVQGGHAISGIAHLDETDLEHMAAALPAGRPSERPERFVDVQAQFLEAISALRMDEAEQLLSRVALSTEPSEFLHQLVGPILTEVGDLWEEGKLRIVHEHACSTVMRGLLFSLMRLYSLTDARRSVVVATPKGEQHELGALMIAMLAAMHGWRVLYLGTDLPAEEIAYAAVDAKAELLLLSITSLSAVDTTREVATIERLVPEAVRILIGGRAAVRPSQSRVQASEELSDAEVLLRA